MNPKVLTTMAATGAILTLLALSMDSGRDTRAAWSRATEPLFAELATRVEQVDRLSVESTHGTTTLVLRGGEWQVAERSHYLGREDEVARLLMSLAEAIRVEPLTSQAERLSSLGLGGFEEETSPTVRLSVAAGDSVLADLYIGNRRPHGVGESWYVREPGSDQAWAVQAKLRCPAQTSEWLQTELMDISRDRIARVRIEHAGGELIDLQRQGEAGNGFDITNTPEGRSAKTAASAAGFLGSLANLRISDVQAADASTFPPQPDSTTTWWTRGGLMVRAELAEVDELLLCRLSSAWDEAHAPEPELGPSPTVVPDGEFAEALQGDSSVEGQADTPPTPEQLRAESEDLGASTQDWVFVLPSWKKGSFTTQMEDLLIPLEDEEDGPEEDAAPAPTEIPSVGLPDGGNQ